MSPVLVFSYMNCIMEEGVGSATPHLCLIVVGTCETNVTQVDKWMMYFVDVEDIMVTVFYK
jgi:hypothetical protein